MLMEIRQNHPVYKNDQERLERLRELKDLCEQKLRDRSGEASED